MTPTYNESTNVVRLVEEINALKIPCDILVVDDNSPDGTGQVAESLKAAHSNLIVQHRAGKLGIGSAHMEAIRYAYEQGYKRLVTMDCDFTHPPTYLPKFLSQAGEYDLVVGNRYLNIRSLEDWPFHRRLLTKSVHYMTMIVLGIPFDATNAFRCYNLETINPRVFDGIKSSSYSFFFESINQLWLAGVSTIEIPIHLPARVIGESKMKFRDILNSFRVLCQLLALRFGRMAPKQQAPQTTPEPSAEKIEVH